MSDVALSDTQSTISGMRTCTACNQEKREDEFYARKNSKYLRHQCKVCANFKRRYDLVANMLSNSKARAKRKGLEFDLDKEFLLKLRDEQQNRCALSGVLLDWDHTKSSKRKCPDNRASIDRIDSSKGYTRDNIQLLADMVNRVKNNYTQDAFINMCVRVSELHGPSKNS